MTSTERLDRLRHDLEAAGLPVESLNIVTDDAGPAPRVVRQRRPCAQHNTRPLFADTSDDAA